MARVQHYQDGLDKLTDYVYLKLARMLDDEKHLLPRERKLLRYVRETGDISPIVAEALMMIADDLYDVDDPDKPAFDDGRPRALDQEEALKLVKAHGSLRLAALKSGISRSALQRATSGVYRDYTTRVAA